MSVNRAFLREARRHNATNLDQRDPFQRDRDRILYSSAFRRLSGVTQIVRADEGDVFHNRLTHSIKVAQVGRRLAERCKMIAPEDCDALQINADVVEAACLAHDLGHPPFGHVGEKALNEKVEHAGDLDGFEGNAQSFRILTKLSVRFDKVDGLDLTSATLSAVLKYPWLRDKNDINRSKKWNAYRVDKEDFDFAMSSLPPLRKSPEAELMDFADDIAYSVHDLEDFHRCRVIPWHLLSENSEQEALVKAALSSWHEAPPNAEGLLRKALHLLAIPVFLADEVKRPYDGTKEHRKNLRFLTSRLIGRYIGCFSVSPIDAVAEGAPAIVIPDEKVAEIKLLKEITREYVIKNPALSAQQYGYKRLIGNLFDDFREDLVTSNRNPQKLKVIPNRFKHLAETNISDARLVADSISGLSEPEAIRLHARLRGIASGSVLDPIVI